MSYSRFAPPMNVKGPSVGFTIHTCKHLTLCAVRGRCSSKSPNFGTSPYNEDLNKSWPADITPIPRATLSWETPGSIEMTEGGSTNTLVEKNHHSNGLVSSAMTLFPLWADQASNPPSVCSLLLHLSLCLLTNTNLNLICFKKIKAPWRSL